ncbi:MAG: membrane protein [Gammaproteobacteria bacterium]|nr:MAG: membrane protein [Gammaproteobacteria bacterium]
MYWTLIKIGLVRKRLRTFLTIMSMFVAFWLYGTLNTAAALFTGSIDGLNAENVMVMPRYEMFGKLPYSHVSFIEQIEGVEEVIVMDFLIADSIESMMDGVVYAVSPNFFEVYDRFVADPKAITEMINNPNATIVGKLMAETRGLEIGDILAIKSNSMNSNGSYDWSFQVVGFYTAKQIKGDEMGAIINWNSFDEARLSLKGTVGYIMAKVSDVSLSNKISNIIDERYMNSSYATRSGPESIIGVEMAGEIADVELIINAILMAVFFTILLVSGNTMAQSIRERRSDIGVLKCLGYEDKAIFIGVILEAITICFAAVIAGLIFTLLLIPLIEVASGGLMDDVLGLKGSTVLGASLIGLLIAFMAAAFPAHQALRLKVVDALREG